MNKKGRLDGMSIGTLYVSNIDWSIIKSQSKKGGKRRCIVMNVG